MTSYNFPDHPVIQQIERTGYPSWQEPEYPICPVCGAECETVYKSVNPYHVGMIVGCDVCLFSSDAWEAEECFPEQGRREWQ